MGINAYKKHDIQATLHCMSYLHLIDDLTTMK